MPVRRDPRTGGWFFRSTVKLENGTRKRIYGTPGKPGPFHDLAPTKVGAKEAERRAIARALTGSIARPQRKEVPTIREYVKPFLEVYAAAHKPSTQLDKKHRLNAYILQPLGDVRLDALKQQDVDELVAGLLRRGLGRKTINNVTSTLSALVRYAVRNKVIPPVDLRFTIKSQDTEIVAVHKKDVAKLVEATADPRYRAAILLAADAGLRIGEVRALAWADVNDLARELSICRSVDRSGCLTETKGWERRSVPMSDRLCSAMQALDRMKSWIVPRLRGERPLSYDTAREAILAIYERAAVPRPPKPWHSLRHTFGTELANAGVPVHVIRELMGHKSIETTLRYMHTGREARRSAVASLGSHAAADDMKHVK